jgi:uncharacterized protein
MADEHPGMSCPNPNCPERRLPGPISQHDDGMSWCPICGTPLVTEHPSVPPLQVKPRVWPVFVAFGILMSVQVPAGILVVVLVAAARFGKTALRADNFRAVSASAPVLFGLLAVMIALGAGLALAGAWLSPTPWRQRLQLRKTPLRPLVLVAGSAAIISVGAIFMALTGLGVVPQSHALEALDRVLKGLSAPEALLAVLLIGLLPGLAEELLFRGYFQARLVARWGVQWGILWTALMFGVSHLDPVQGVFAIIVGSILGFVAVRTGSVVPAMICHAANNTLSTVVALITHDVTNKAANAAIALIAVVVLVFSILYLRAHLPATSEIHSS